MAMYIWANLGALAWYMAWFGPSLITLWFLIRRKPASREVAFWVALTLVTGFVGSSMLAAYLVMTRADHYSKSNLTTY